MSGFDVEGHLQSRLRALPNSKDGIADFMRQRGIKGVIYSSTECPIALYLKEGLPSPYGVACGKRYVSVWVADRYEENVSVTLPAPVTEFVEMFDGKCYGDLIERAMHTPISPETIPEIPSEQPDY